MTKRRVTPKTNSFTVLSAEETTLRKMPKPDGFAVGHGVHGDTSYNRRRTKAELRKEIDDEAER